MDPLCDPLTTRPIQTGWEFTMEPYPSGQFGFIDDPDRQFGNGSVWTRTRTQSDGPEPLLTLPQCYEVGSAALNDSRRTALEVSRRYPQRSQELQNSTILQVKSHSILNAPPKLWVLSGAPENALAESQSTLLSSRGVWDHLEVLGSTGE